MALKRRGIIVAAGLALCLGAEALRADIPFFWLDRPASRSNPHDPASPKYVPPVVGPSATHTPIAFLTMTSTPTQTPLPTPVNTVTATPSPSPAYTATDTPSPSPAYTLTSSPTPSATPTASPTYTPSSCSSDFSFESGAQGWVALTSSELAVTAVSPSTTQFYCGQSLALTVDLRQSPAANQGGQALVNSPGFPMDLSCSQVTAWIWAPAGMSSATYPAGAFIYAFTGAGWAWTPGTWVNLPNAGGWTQLTLDLNGAPGADQVQQLGVKVALGAGSLDYAGTLYLDEVDIVSVACATQTPTPVGGTATPTPTPSPTPDCPLLPNPGLTRDWYTGSGVWDKNDPTLAPTGYGGTWDADIAVSNANPRTTGNNLAVTMAWTGYSGSEGYNWAGWYEPNAVPPYARKVDADLYDAFEFWIRGAVGGEDAIAVRLVDGAVTPTASTIVNINSILGGPLTTTYQKVVIPLCRFDFTGVDKSQLWEVNFLTDNPATDSGSMVFYVDDGQFVKYEATAPTPTATPTPLSCFVPGGSPINEVAWWTAMPPVAQVWSSNANTGFTMDSANPRTPGNNHMVWAVGLSGYYAGGSINWTNWGPPEVDGTQFDTFEFWVRGAAGGEPVTISIGFTSNGGATGSTNIVPIAPYMGPLTATYQLVRVPLCAFDWTNADPTKLWQLDLAFGGADTANYTLYVDEGYFRKY